MDATTTSRPARRLSELLDPQFMARLDGLDILSRRILAGKLAGERRSKRRGYSAEFAEHRQYAVGDDLRFLDWNVYARLDQLFVKLFLEEQDLTVELLLDVSGSTAETHPEKALAMRRIAAAIAYIALVNNNRVSVSTFSDGLGDRLSNLRGRSRLTDLAELLLAGPGQGGSDFDRACRQLAMVRTGTGVVIVVSDMLFKDGYESGLGRLAAGPRGRSDLYVVQVLHPQEIEPELAGDLKLIDVEDGDAAEVTVNGSVLSYYRRALAGYCNELKQFCARRGGSYMLARSDDPPEMVVLKHLRHRGLIG